ncbi:MAG: hypothetical protein J2P22_04405 [Nocardioides sp.]|nr:hypothetical protein [Nocardioides sp.]
MAWVTWRRHRGTVVVLLAVLAVTGIYLLVTGLQMRSAWHTVQACTPQRSSACSFAWNNFRNTHTNPGLISALFLFAPLLIGAFVGAPLVGRELETGTFRYAWTQGVGRNRWAIAMVVTGAAVVAVSTGLLGALVSWHEQPLWRADVTPRLQPSEFPSTGLAIVGWGLATYAVAVLAGLLWRRVLPALATAVLATFALAYAASRFRLHILSPLVTSSLAYVPGSQPISQWWEKAGARVSTAELNAVLRAGGLQQINSSGGKTTVQVVPNEGTDPVTYLLHHGFTQWTSYQPASRYWTLQWIEFGWLTALALVIIAIALLLLRHRDA